MKIGQIFCIAVIALSYGCGQEKKSAEQKSDSIIVAPEVEIADPETKTAYANYIMLKQALVKSDADLAIGASTALSKALKNIEGCEPTSKIADKISATNNLTEQRKQFVILSNDFIPLIRHTSISNGNIFVQFCPMANEGKGAYWLASEKEIKNPYYGDEMLECGEVKEEIKSN